MGELVFIGLGIHDEKGITLKGLEEARRADAIFAEFYTAALPGTTVDKLAAQIGKPIRQLTRPQIESSRDVIEAATTKRVALLVPGDPMAATTHVDLRLRAAAAGIPTRIVHGVSILSAAAGALGLQAYKFGRTTTIPFTTASFRPTSPLDAILENLGRGLHTLVLLDLKEDGTFLTAQAGLRYLLETARENRTGVFGPKTLACVLGRVGAPDARLVAAAAEDLLAMDLGPPLQCLVVPGPLHFKEKEALVAFAGAPADL